MGSLCYLRPSLKRSSSSVEPFSANLMSDSPIFELVCEHVEAEAKLTRLEARGTVRLLLKEVGLDGNE